MFKRGFRSAQAFTLAVFTLLLSACFEVGLNQGSNVMILNGSLLKGVISHANVSLFNAQGALIWQGVSDSNGQYQLEVSSEGQIFTVITELTQNSTMMCDAIECIAPVSGKSYRFGEAIPGSELANVQIKDVLFADLPSDSKAQRQVRSQTNSLSTLVYDTMAEHLSDNLSKAQFSALSQSSSALVGAALGLSAQHAEQILDLALPNVNQPQTLANAQPSAAIMAIINASRAKNIADLNRFSAALSRYIHSPQDQAAKVALVTLQQKWLGEAQAMMDSGLLNGANPALRDNIGLLLQNGIDFSAMSAAIESYSVASGVLPRRFTASSSHWGGGLKQRSKQWWWVSAANTVINPWVKLNYEQMFAPTAAMVSLDRQYVLENGKIQASQDGLQWHDLGRLDQLEVMASDVDSRQVRHILFSLPSEQAYPQYRFLNSNGSSAWLESLCFFAQSPAPQTLSCQAAQAVQSSEALASRFGGFNVNNSDADTWWISELATNQVQWLQISYSKPFVASRVSLVVKHSHQGQGVVLQGSIDGFNWHNLTALSDNPYPGEYIDQQGFRHLEIDLNNAESYLHYRYHSQPSSFIWLQYLSFNSPQTRG